MRAWALNPVLMVALMGVTVAKLKEQCMMHNVKGVSNKTKADIVKLLAPVVRAKQDAEAARAAPATHGDAAAAAAGEEDDDSLDWLPAGAGADAHLMEGDLDDEDDEDEFAQVVAVAMDD